jgi:hypothetical protein
MTRDGHSKYRGSTVTVLWTESKSATSPGHMYTAGYLLVSEDGKDSHWRHFAKHAFQTYDTAADYALKQAHRFIDAQSTARPQSTNGSKPR